MKNRNKSNESFTMKVGDKVIAMDIEHAVIGTITEITYPAIYVEGYFFPENVVYFCTDDKLRQLNLPEDKIEKFNSGEIKMFRMTK